MDFDLERHSHKIAVLFLAMARSLGRTLQEPHETTGPCLCLTSSSSSSSEGRNIWLAADANLSVSDARRSARSCSLLIGKVETKPE